MINWGIWHLSGTKYPQAAPTTQDLRLQHCALITQTLFSDILSKTGSMEGRDMIQGYDSYDLCFICVRSELNPQQCNQQLNQL